MIISEPWMFDLLQKLLPLRKGVFIDIGVNTGQTLIKLKAVQDDREWVGFEPNPKCVYYVSELIKANQFRHCRLIPVGIFSREAILELEFYSDSDTDQAASVIENFRPGEKVFERVFIPVSSFERVNLLLGLQEIGIIKIDVEGAETEVMDSLRDALRKLRPLVMMEILPCYTSDNETRIGRQSQIEEMLRLLEYRIFRVMKPDGIKLEGLAPIAEIGIHGDLNMCEYVMAPAEIAGSI